MGLIVPFNVAELEETEVAEPVVTEGGVVGSVPVAVQVPV